MKTTTKNPQRGHSNKQVNIIERRVLRRLGLVVYRCKSSRGESVYNTTLKNGLAVSCTCPGHAQWGKTCYHMSETTRIETERLREERETRNAYWEMTFIA